MGFRGGCYYGWELRIELSYCLVHIAIGPMLINAPPLSMEDDRIRNKLYAPALIRIRGTK